MSSSSFSMSLYHCQINTDNIDLIGKFLEKENFHQHSSSSSTFIKSDLDCNIQINLSQSFENPSIICCCSTTLPQLLSLLNSNSSSNRSLILFIQSSENVDWNILVPLITTYNLSLNIVNNENDFSRKLHDIMNDLAKPNITKRKILMNNNNDQQSLRADIEV